MLCLEDHKRSDRLFKKFSLKNDIMIELINRDRPLSGGMP